MSSLTKALAGLECHQRDYYKQLGLSPPSLDDFRTDHWRLEDYLRSDPDVTAADLARWQMSKPLPPRNDVSGLGFARNVEILSKIVGEMRAAADRVGKSSNLDKICYGLIPGGGLDAYSFKTTCGDTFAVVVPEGLFHLVNLFCKQIILLQPLQATEKGPVYPNYRSLGKIDLLTQVGLACHPYVSFRHSDVLDAYFVHGDPTAALPYFSALPYQDRFAYLLTGTELYVVAHEAAHVVLGHLDAEVDLRRPEIEFAADTWALDIVTEYFQREAHLAKARASLCGMLFHWLNAMWEEGLRRAFQTNGELFAIMTHPAYETRMQHFHSQLNSMQGETPPWYTFVCNAIEFATRDPATAHIAELAADVAGLKIFSARILPLSYAHFGHHRPPPRRQPLITIMKLLTSSIAWERKLGLWFLLELAPHSAVGIYEGVGNDDSDYSELCRRALVSIEPLYAGYFPRLVERFREESEEGTEDAYIFHISQLLLVKAKEELGVEKIDKGPLDWSFFE